MGCITCVALHGVVGIPTVNGQSSRRTTPDNPLSGLTVAAAMEATLLGVPSIAFSLVGRGDLHFETPALWLDRIVKKMITDPPPKKTLWNVNFPNSPATEIRGIRVTRLGIRVYENAVIRKTDPRGRDYYWIGGQEPTWEREDETDFQAVHDGYISITPIHLDLNHYDSIRTMAEWVWEE